MSNRYQEEVGGGMSVETYFRVHGKNGVLLLCVDNQGEPTAKLERSPKGDVEFVTRDARYHMGDSGLLQLWEMICWSKGTESRLN